jgi:hypothetical protein
LKKNRPKCSLSIFIVKTRAAIGSVVEQSLKKLYEKNLKNVN